MWLQATAIHDGITSDRTVITTLFEYRSNNKLTLSKHFFFLGQCQNPSSRFRAKSGCGHCWGPGGPRASFITAASVWSSGSQKGFYSADSAVWAAHGRGMQMSDAPVGAFAARAIQWGLTLLTAPFWNSHRGKPEPIWSYSSAESVMWQRGQSHSCPETVSFREWQ